jgi:hypothetical protein
MGVRIKREWADDKGGRYMDGKLIIGGALLAGLLATAPTVDAASVVVVRPFFGHHHYGYYGPAYGWYWYPGPVVVDVPRRTGEVKFTRKIRPLWFTSTMVTSALSES